jgi:hypothetical protein
VRILRRKAEPAENVKPRRGAAAVSSTPSTPSPKTWNLWELERLAEELNGGARAEERALLLLYLREFAEPSGQLPAEFDSLVRDAFREIVS